MNIVDQLRDEEIQCDNILPIKVIRNMIVLWTTNGLINIITVDS